MADIRTRCPGLPVTEQQKTYVVFVTTDVKRDTGGGDAHLAGELHRRLCTRRSSG